MGEDSDLQKFRKPEVANRMRHGVGPIAAEYVEPLFHNRMMATDRVTPLGCCRRVSKRPQTVVQNHHLRHWFF